MKTVEQILHDLDSRISGIEKAIEAFPERTTEILTLQCVEIELLEIKKWILE